MGSMGNGFHPTMIFVTFYHFKRLLTRSNNRAMDQHDFLHYDVGESSESDIATIYPRKIMTPMGFVKKLKHASGAAHNGQ